MQKAKNMLEKIKMWSLRKKIFYGIIIVILALAGYMIFKPRDNSANITTDTVKLTNLKQTVLATGQVTSNTDLNLSFFSSGIIRTVKVKVGDEVKSGQVLATLDQGNELASLTQARGAVAAAQAKYQAILDGASNEEIKLAQIAVQNAKNSANNAYNALLANNLTAIPSKNPSSTDTIIATTPTISGTYTGEQEGSYLITIYLGTNSYFTTTGIENFTGPITTSTSTPLGTKELFIQFPADYSDNSSTQWIVSIPNTKSLTYVTYYNAYKSAQNTIDQKEAELSIKQASARQPDIDLAKANILTAEGQLQSASANFEHTILRAPTNGTITKVDTKIGELVQALKNIMTLQDINNMYLEANINEANITSVKIGAAVNITFDAFSTEQIFLGNILKIDPSSTIVSGVVNYKITANVPNAPELRPGMTANMTILAGEKNGILTTPSRAVIKDKTGKKTIRLITNTKTKTYKEVEIATGMEGDGGLTEVTAGLAEGDEIIVLIKK